MNKWKSTALFLTFVLIGSISIGVVSYFFANSIISKNKNNQNVNVENNDNNIINIHDQIDKFELAKQTFDLTKFINNNLISYNKPMIEKNLYNLVSSVIYDKFYNIDKKLIDIKIYYQINYNNLNIIADWKINYNISNSDFYNEYYDKFTLNIDRKKYG